jgi:hypothetical protein
VSKRGPCRTKKGSLGYVRFVLECLESGERVCVEVTLDHAFKLEFALTVPFVCPFRSDFANNGNDRSLGIRRESSIYFSNVFRIRGKLVDAVGIEPTTSRLRVECSTN